MGTKKEMTEALTLFLNDRTEEFTTWLYQMLDNIRKRREKQKESDEKGPDELEIGVGTQDDLDRELIGDDDKKSDKKRDDKKSERKSDKKRRQGKPRQGQVG